MKPLRLLRIICPVLILTLVANSITNAQTTVIDYDLKQAPPFKRVEWLKEGSQVMIRFVGVNKYAVKATTTMTSGMRSYEDGLTELQAGLNSVAAAKSATDEAAVENNQKLKTASAKKQNTAPLDILERYLTAKAGLISSIEAEFRNIRPQIMKINSIMAIDKDIIAATNDPSLNSKELLVDAIFLQKNSSGVSQPQDFSSQLNNAVGTITTAIANIRSKARDMESNLAKLNDEQRKAEEPKLQKLLSEISESVQEVEEPYKGQNLKTLQDNSADMARRSLTLLAQDFIVAPTLIGTADGDYLEVSAKLTDNSGKQLAEIQPFKIYTYGGRRIDFSVGVAVNIGGHGKYDYDLRKNPTNATSGTAVDSVILLQDDEDRLFKFSPAIFVHWYKTTRRGVQWMSTTGLTPDFSDFSTTRISLGTSLGLPSSNPNNRRIVITGGVSLGFADVLKTKYKGLNDYRSFGELDPAELTRKAIKLGGFVAISYNLGGSGHD